MKMMGATIEYMTFKTQQCGKKGKRPPSVLFQSCNFHALDSLTNISLLALDNLQFPHRQYIGKTSLKNHAEHPGL